MTREPIVVLPPQTTATGGATVRGETLVIGSWPARVSDEPREVAPLHVHHADDEAWHVVEGAIRFRFRRAPEATDDVLVAEAGTTVIVPAGTPHTFGNAGPTPSRYLIILPARLDELIAELHKTPPHEHGAVYARYESTLLE